MPNCFSLTKIGKTAPMPLNQIDEIICKHFGAEVDNVRWFREWYNTIGFSLATGKTFDDIINSDDWSESTKDVAKFLKDNFTTDAWAEIGKR